MAENVKNTMAEFLPKAASGVVASAVVSAIYFGYNLGSFESEIKSVREKISKLEQDLTKQGTVDHNRALDLQLVQSQVKSLESQVGNLDRKIDSQFKELKELLERGSYEKSQTRR